MCVHAHYTHSIIVIMCLVYDFVYVNAVRRPFYFSPRNRYARARPLDCVDPDIIDVSGNRTADGGRRRNSKLFRRYPNVFMVFVGSGVSRNPARTRAAHYNIHGVLNIDRKRQCRNSSSSIFSADDDTM